MTQPVRTCLGCRGRATKAELLRLVWNPAEGVVVIDGPKELPGRGCYVHPACCATAIRRRAVGRALRRPVDTDQVAALLSGLGA